MLLTVGHAIDRAKDEDLVVRLHVGGEWVAGRIISNDGHGVALLETSGDLCVFRTEAITGIRLPGTSNPRHARPETQEQRVHEAPMAEACVPSQNRSQAGAESLA